MYLFIIYQLIIYNRYKDYVIKKRQIDKYIYTDFNEKLTNYSCALR